MLVEIDRWYYRLQFKREFWAYVCLMFDFFNSLRFRFSLFPSILVEVGY